MKSEVRLKNYDTYANILTIVYSFTLICISIAQAIDSTQNVDLAPLHIVVLSLAVFTLSVIIYFADFGGKAALYRECYLRLDKLLATENDEGILASSYHEILQSYPNHLELDFYELVIKSKANKGQDITDAGGKSVKPKFSKQFRHAIFSRLVPAVFFCLLCFPAYLLFGLLS